MKSIKKVTVKTVSKKTDAVREALKASGKKSARCGKIDFV